MIETPAALYALDEILELADFVAIGTNDLTQYMLAADRDLAEGTDDCTAMHPAVLRAIRQVVEAAEERQCPVCVCGEEAGDARLRLLAGWPGDSRTESEPTSEQPPCAKPFVKSTPNVQRKLPTELFTAGHRVKYENCFSICRSAEANDSAWQNGQAGEPTTLALSGAPVATQLSEPVTDRRQSLREMNEGLKYRVAEGTSRLSEATCTPGRQRDKTSALLQLHSRRTIAL